MRTITVYSTKNTTVKCYETETTSWEEFRNTLINDGYDLHNLQATENINRTTLLNLDAVLPDQDFVLFLRPIETKQGATMTRSEIYAKLNEDPDLKDFVKDIVSTDNYTHASSDELEDLINKYYGSGEDIIDDEEIEDDDIFDDDDEADDDDEEFDYKGTIQGHETTEAIMTKVSLDLEATMQVLKEARVAINKLQECISSLHIRLNLPDLEEEARKLERRML